MASNRVTIQEIGERLRISTSTVSRALRQDPLIHPETRARVATLAMGLGYQGRARRGAMSGKRTCSLGVLLSLTSLTKMRSGFITTCYMQGLAAESENQEIRMSLHAVLGDHIPEFADTGGIPRGLHNGECDAAILIGHHGLEAVKLLVQKMPVISLVYRYPGVTHDLVDTPDISGMRMIVQEFVRHGHRRLAWIGNSAHGSFEGRKAGFISGCVASGLKLSEQVFFPDELFDGERGHDLKELLEAHKNGVTGFVCANDHTATIVTRTLRANRLRVPNDMSVSGFDNEPREYVERGDIFTGLDPQFVEMGRAAVRLAKWRLEQPSVFPSTLMIEGRLVVGNTVAVV